MSSILQRRILIADDEHVIADTLATILTQTGFTARAVYSGEEAVEVSEFYLPDMLISDVMMGGISGIEAANDILTKLPECKILLFSGQAASARFLKEAEKYGRRFEILQKPIHPSDMIERLRVAFTRGELICNKKSHLKHD